MAVPENLKNIVEAALLASGRPLSLDLLQSLFTELELPEKKELRVALTELSEDYAGRGIEVKEVSSGWRIQVVEDCSPWVSRLWDERPARYSRALMETLALIAYRQPITRGEIEDVRGVSVSSNIIKTLLEREWIRVVGQRDVPGKPSLYGSTREFLDYFNLKSLDELPTLAEIRDLDEINRELDLNDPDKAPEGEGSEGEVEVEGDESTVVTEQTDDVSGVSEEGIDADAISEQVTDEDSDAELSLSNDVNSEESSLEPEAEPEAGTVNEVATELSAVPIKENDEEPKNG